MAKDFMGIMRKCAHCRLSDETVCWSKSMDCYVCDDCYTTYNDAQEDANITSCYPVNE